MGVSVPSLHRESTDSLIYVYYICIYITNWVLLQCLLLLEKELIALGTMCAVSLLRDDTVLPFTGK